LDKAVYVLASYGDNHPWIRGRYPLPAMANCPSKCQAQLTSTTCAPNHQSNLSATAPVCCLFPWTHALISSGSVPRVEESGNSSQLPFVHH